MKAKSKLKGKKAENHSSSPRRRTQLAWANQHRQLKISEEPLSSSPRRRVTIAKKGQVSLPRRSSVRLGKECRAET